MSRLHSQAVEYVEQNQTRLVAILQELIRQSSENRSPQGSEAPCQAIIASRLRQAGYAPDVYEPDSVSELRSHPLATPDRNYRGRPNVAARRAGRGQGRSLILSGHIDTVPRGELPWSRDPFGGQIQDGRLYGRGANDMKAGIAINLFLMEALGEMNLPLRGDLTFESVVDEEFGGVNGTLAARLRGYMADAAVLTEPSSLRICPAQRGGRTAHLLFRAGGGVLGDRAGAGVVEQATRFLAALPEFARRRRVQCRPHPLYARCADPVPVTVTKISTGPWGTGEPVTIPEECRIEVYWQLMPGETQQDADQEFLSWLDDAVRETGGQAARGPEVTFPIRWLPGSAIDPASPLCLELQREALHVLGTEAEIAGIEGPCDMFVFHKLGMPAVLWGPSGGGTHGSDEFVDIASLVSAAKVLMGFVCRWCGTPDGDSA